MIDKTKIRPGMMVHAQGDGGMGGAPGEHVGTVDHIDGEYIKLRKNDSSDDQHHWIPLEFVDTCDEKAVYLNLTRDEAEDLELDADPNFDKRKAV